MKIGRPKQTVLVISLDPALRDVRKGVLEDAGYRVIAPSDMQALIEACQKHAIDLIMIGYSLPPTEKRAVSAEARKHCNVPILELYEATIAEVIDENNTRLYRADTPEEFLQATESILAGSAGSGKKAG